LREIGALFAAHSQPSDPLMGTAMWIAVPDDTVANGALQVIPDVFRTAFEHSRDPFSDHLIRCYPPEEKAVPLELPAAGVAFFCYGTPHATGANTTDRERAQAAIHVLRADCARGVFACAGNRCRAPKRSCRSRFAREETPS
jgi:ectoine hydroxylase-related dioxygenase (phytanoyl-CoA dioxygenase family)